MIKLDRVSFGYSGETTIKNVSFDIPDGDFVAIIGSNGAGKSTVSRIIRGLIRAQSGTVSIDGKDISKIRASALAAKIGFLFQNPDRQICKNTIREELMFGLNYTVPDTERRTALCDKAIADFGFDESADPFSLSRGERQRVALASVVVGEPDIIILDEPTTGLDYLECVHIMDIVRALNEKGKTVIMICHDMELVLDYAKHTVVMTDGEVVAQGETKDIFYTADLLDRTSLLPPQIIGLSMLTDRKYGRITTVTEMADAIEAEKRGTDEKHTSLFRR